MILTIDTTEGVRFLASPTVQERQAKLTQSPSLLILVRKPSAQDHRWSVMVDLAHLELFHGVGRGGHRHDDSPVIAGVIGVNVLQLLHKIRQHGGHPDAPLVSSLYASLDKVDQSRQMNLSVPGEQIK